MSETKHLRTVALAACLVAACMLLVAAPAYADDDLWGPGDNSYDPQPVEMHRLYNPNSGEHFYTADITERDHLTSVGWSYEGVGWLAPSKSRATVFRLYNPYTGDHHYTTNSSEWIYLGSKWIGWIDEGIGWYSDTNERVPVYRQYNPNAAGAGSHNYTVDEDERDHLIALGWVDEGIGWYGMGTRMVWAEEQGHYEDVVVQEAWDEPIYELRKSCANCGGGPVRYLEEIPHAADCDDKSRELHGNYQVGSTHHDAVTEQRWVVDVPGHWE